MLDTLGYIASLVVLISLLMTSVKKLRVINLIGSTIFAVYAFLIPSYPTAVMNLGIVFINIYFLVNLHKAKDNYHMVEIESESELYTDFIETYKNDMKTFMNTDIDFNDENLKKYFVTRNAVPAGLFIAKLNAHKLEILIDYTIPMYRDYKVGKHLYSHANDFCGNLGVTYLSAKPGSSKHRSYLEKMGFVSIEKNNQIVMEKLIDKQA
ncbi:YgjV family protein [Mycoplasmatota bacterium]|nr:YgjV family protein [Mycoplasmatota bacterium]